MLSPFCFADCRLLSSVTFEQGSRLQTIGSHAFSECISLQSIVIPKSVEDLGESCFFQCRLSSVSFEQGSCLQTIGSHAFSECISLRSIVIPKGVEELGEGCFVLCSALTSVTFERGSRLRRLPQGTFANCSQQLQVILHPDGKSLSLQQLAQGWQR
ncbi:MAG: leucine-rich repeat domain-containing protein [Holosporales bacterium]|nr:leucine-rich repeat domain-containing protein [Holosporales bacterium]